MYSPSVDDRASLTLNTHCQRVLQLVQLPIGNHWMLPGFPYLQCPQHTQRQDVNLPGQCQTIHLFFLVLRKKGTRMVWEKKAQSAKEFYGWVFKHLFGSISILYQFLCYRHGRMCWEWGMMLRKSRKISWYPWVHRIFTMSTETSGIQQIIHSLSPQKISIIALN